MIALRTEPAFDLGVVSLSSQAKGKFGELGVDPVHFINRHVHCDWAEIDEAERDLNKAALTSSEPIVSAYRLGNEEIFVITEADRSETRIVVSDDLVSYH